jgi:DNA-binding MarR family transcriptional regulator
MGAMLTSNLHDELAGRLSPAQLADVGGAASPGSLVAGGAAALPADVAAALRDAPGAAIEPVFALGVPLMLLALVATVFVERRELRRSVHERPCGAGSRPVRRARRGVPSRAACRRGGEGPMARRHGPALLAVELERLITLVRRGGGPHDADDPPLAGSQRLALSALVGGSPLRLRALAERIGTTDATASRTVDALVAFGFVRREPDPADGRGVLVVATPKAVEFVAERRPRLVGILEQGRSEMSRADRERLVSLLAELNDVLDPTIATTERPCRPGRPADAARKRVRSRSAAVRVAVPADAARPVKLAA